MIRRLPRPKLENNSGRDEAPHAHREHADAAARARADHAPYRDTFSRVSVRMPCVATSVVVQREGAKDAPMPNPIYGNPVRSNSYQLSR